MIPPGTFQMGCSPADYECRYDETPHDVTITQGFWMGQTEVTQAAYMRVMGENNSRFKGDQLPVERLSYDKATAYCEAVGMRLPTEAQWEYAARGGSPWAHYANLDLIAWTTYNSNGRTHEVGQKLPNEYGLYDMLGNVWEIVTDWYGPYAEGAATDPDGPAMPSREGNGRVFRGGSWWNVAVFVRVTHRLEERRGFGLEYGADRFGFRCVGD